MVHPIIRILAKQIAKKVAIRGARELAERIFLEEGNEEENLQQAFERGEISEQEIEEVTMVDFQAFMSVALSECGNDQRTFSQLTDLWNREKENIQSMTVAELRRNLRCP